MDSLPFIPTLPFNTQGTVPSHTQPFHTCTLILYLPHTSSPESLHTCTLILYLPHTQLTDLPLLYRLYLSRLDCEQSLILLLSLLARDGSGEQQSLKLQETQARREGRRKYQSLASGWSPGETLGNWNFIAAGFLL